MASSSESFNLGDVVKKIRSAKAPDDKKTIFSTLTSAQKKLVRATISEQEEAEKKAADSALDVTGGGEGSDSDVDDNFLGAASSTTEEKKPKGKQAAVIAVKDADVAQMWDMLEKMEARNYDLSGISDFDYVGFNPSEVLKSIMAAGLKAGYGNNKIINDIGLMAGLAQKKGSVNNHNYTKMSKDGQKLYDRLAKDYGLKKGGGKGEPSNIITVSRIGPTFPGVIVQLLLDNKLTARSFAGPLRSSTLPTFMQTQAFPPIIPTGLAEASKVFLLGLCVAYSVDQSLAIQGGKNKPTVASVISTQQNFIVISHSGIYPSEKFRLQTFLTIDWNAHFDSLSACATAYRSNYSEFSIQSKSDFLSDINKITKK